MELLENSVPVQRAKPLNIKKEIGRYLKKWPWFLLSLLLFYTAAKIYLRYAQPQFYTKTSLNAIISCTSSQKRCKFLMVLIFKKGKAVIHESRLALSLYSR